MFDLPVPPCQAIEDPCLRDVVERLGDRGGSGGACDALPAKILPQPMLAETLVLQARARIARGEAVVVDVAFLAQALERALDLPGFEALAQQGAAQLARGVIAPREPFEGALVGGLG